MTRDTDNRGDALPKARIAKKSRIGWIWVVPLFALGFVGWLIARTYIYRGPRIEVQFKQSQGLEPGKSELHFRGARIGLVSDVRLAKDLKAVIVKMELDKSAADVARDGSLFWIVEPEVTAERIRGLRAIVSGDYVEVKPGDGPRTNRFVGLDEPPVIAEERPGVKIVLLNPKVGSVQRGSPVYYRGVQVGEVTAFQLTSDGQAVSVTAQIDQHYATLVRENSKFWNAGGIQVSLGLFSGANIRAESMKSLIAGGIAFATPDPPGNPIKDGVAFRLYDKADENWEKWAPSIPLSPTNKPPDFKEPRRPGHRF